MAFALSCRAIVSVRSGLTFPDVFPKETLCIRRNDFGLPGMVVNEKLKRKTRTKAVLDNQKAPSSNSNESNSSERARAALEKLFSQSQKLERDSVADYDGSDGGSDKYDLDITSLEVYVHDAIEALQLKEEELRAAECAVKAEEEDVKRAKSALLDREREMEAACDTHIRINEELSLAKKERSDQAVELSRLKEALKLQQMEVSLQRESLSCKQDELILLRKELLQKDEALAVAAAELETRASRLAQARDFISKQAIQLGELRNALQDREMCLAAAEREKKSQQEKLDAAEADLEKRAITWFKAQDQLKFLQQELSCSKSKADSTEKELTKLSVLLSQVRGELESSQKEIENSRSRMQVQKMHIRKQRDEVLEQQALLKKLEIELAQAQKEVNEEGEKLKLMEVSCIDLKKQLNESREQAEALKMELQKGKRDLEESVSEANFLRRELQQKDSALSDTQLLLQLKEAELIRAKMEVQQVHSDHTVVQLIVKNINGELEEAQKNVNSLQNEVFKLTSDIQAKEAQLEKVLLQLDKKEMQLKSMKVTLNHNSIKLSEVTSFVEQIAALSRTLVDTDNPDRAAVLNEETQLMRANYELFAQNRSNFEKELQIHYLKKKSLEDGLKITEAEAELELVKDCLREREIELLKGQRDLTAKDQEVSSLLQKWEVREEELKKLRDEIMEEAKGLETLHVLAQVRSGAENQSSADVATAKLELEAARLNAEAAVCALESLAELSQDLVKVGSLEEATSNGSGTSKQIGNTEKVKHSLTDCRSSHGSMDFNSTRARWNARDAAINATRKAVENLSKLTRSLKEEACLGLQVNGIQTIRREIVST